MRITNTRPVVTAVALTAALALIASGCGGNTGSKGAKPTSTATAGDPDEPMGHSGGGEMMPPDQMTKMTPKPMMPAMPSKEPESRHDKTMAPDQDNGRPGQVNPGDPASTSTVPSAARPAVAKTRPHVQRSPRVGRLIAVDGHYAYFCSASVIPSHGKNLIITAGHCLFDEQQKWLKNFEFIPGYYAKGHHGYAPYGVYTAKQWWTPRAYAEDQNVRYDFAFLKLRRGAPKFHGAGKNVEQVVGSEGVEWSQPPKRRFASIGYDAERRYGWDNGCCAYYRSGTARWDGSFGQMYISHHFVTGGASGGPWLADYDKDRRIGYVNGVNSRSDRRTDFTSSYFGSAFAKFYHKLS